MNIAHVDVGSFGIGVIGQLRQENVFVLYSVKPIRRSGHEPDGRLVVRIYDFEDLRAVSDLINFAFQGSILIAVPGIADI